MSTVADLTVALAAARRSLAAGGLPDLDGLADRLRILLEQTGGDAPDRELPPLVGLLDEVGRLGEALASECRNCRAELARGEASARAMAAYHNRARG